MIGPGTLLGPITSGVVFRAITASFGSTGPRRGSHVAGVVALACRRSLVERVAGVRQPVPHRNRCLRRPGSSRIQMIGDRGI